MKKGLDVLIVGGGINGAGILRDCAMRGISAGLVEKNDFASGTSSRSSKMIHGGLRYIEHLDFPMVLESCSERTILMNIEPELIKTTEFLFPVYLKDRYSLFTINLGLWIYDLLALFRNTRLHRKISKQTVQAIEPGLNPEGLAGGLLYYDCRVNDSRLVFNNIISAQALGGLALNYTDVTGVDQARGKEKIVFIRDRLNQEEYEISCRILVYAVGPWTNHFLRRMENQHKDLLRLTKGIHLIFSENTFKVNRAIIFNSNADRRVIFIIPWEEYTLVGTSDTDYSGNLDSVFPDRREVEGLLELVNQKFPKACLKPEQAISAFAGLRPLVLSSKSASTVSRRDRLFTSPFQNIILGGGKLTTYRKMAQRTVDEIIKALPRQKKLGFRLCQTHKATLLEKPFITEHDRAALKASGLEHDIVDYLIRRYSKNYRLIVEIARSAPELSKRICPELPFIYAEIIYGAEREMLVHITDFFRLRTEIFLKSKDNGLSMLEVAMDMLGGKIGLSEEEKEKQKQEYKDFMINNLRCLGREMN
jgi:glycerol-3-phosphate dehydrogenase